MDERLCVLLLGGNDLCWETTPSIKVLGGDVNLRRLEGS